MLTDFLAAREHANSLLYCASLECGFLTFLVFGVFLSELVKFQVDCDNIGKLKHELKGCEIKGNPSLVEA